MRHDSQVDGSSEAFLSDRDHEVLLLHIFSLRIVPTVPTSRTGNSTLRGRPRLCFESRQDHHSLPYPTVG